MGRERGEPRAREPWSLRRKLALAVLALFVLGLATLAAWVAIAGGDFLWTKVQPRHARILALQGDPEIPDELPPEAWDEDVRALAGELTRRYARFQAAGPVYDRAAFEAEVAGLRRRLAETSGLTREEAVLGLMAIAALPGTGTGHTGIAPFQRSLDWGMVPIHAWDFDDGLWVTLAGPGAEAALGQEIVAVGGVPIAELVARADPALSGDNAWSRRQLRGAALGFEGILRALGATDAAEPGSPVRLTLRDEDGATSELAVEPARLGSIAGLLWGRRLQEPVSGDPLGLDLDLDLASPADPRPRARPFALTHRPEERLLYLRVDRLADEGEDTFEALADRLQGAVEEHPVERFVVDLRANGGGNNELAEPLVDFLSGHPSIDRRGVLYTLIGRRTFSAAGNLAAGLERRTKTLFAGEPTGSSPNHWGDAIDLPLPRSKIFFRVSTRSWQDGGPFDRRPWIAPSPGLAVRTTHADHFAARDPVLAAVLAHEPEPIPEVAVVPALAERAIGTYRFGDYRKLTVIAPPLPDPLRPPRGEEGAAARTSASEPEGAPRLRMVIDGVGRWAVSDLYPVAVDGGVVRYATDLEGVFLESGPSGMTVDWHGGRHPLPRVEASYRTPIERLRESVPDGVAAFREAASESRIEIPDSRTELELNRIGYTLLSEGRTEDAVEVLRLQVELFPEVANSFDSLGEGLRAAGDLQGAMAAFRTALEIDPGFVHARRLLDAVQVEAQAEAEAAQSPEPDSTTRDE